MRITVDRVRDAYDKTGKIPVAGVYRSGRYGHCPVAAILRAEHNMRIGPNGDGWSQSMYVKVAEMLGVSISYLNSFLDGYDDDLDAAPWLDRQGYEDGQKARDAFPPVHQV